MQLNSGVPWWGAILIAVIAASSGLLAVLYQNRLKRVADSRERRRASYYRLITASDIVILHAGARASERSLRSTFGDTLADTSKAIIVAFLSIPAYRSKRFPKEAIPLIAGSLRPIPQIPPAVSPQDSLRAFEELLSAHTDVEIHGSKPARVAAARLNDKGKEFFNALEDHHGLWEKSPNSASIIRCRDEMRFERTAFIEIIRAELISTPKHDRE